MAVQLLPWGLGLQVGACGVATGAVCATATRIARRLEMAEVFIVNIYNRA